MNDPNAFDVDRAVNDHLADARRFNDGVFAEALRAHVDDADAIAAQLRSLRDAGMIGPLTADDAASWDAIPVSDEGADPLQNDDREGTDGTATLPAIGPYRIVREIGRGGQGVVYLAEDQRLNRPVALKLLRGIGALSEIALQRFRREAEVASRLSHAGICPVYDTGIEGDVAYIAMRYVEGETLAALIERARESHAERRRQITVTGDALDRAAAPGSATRADLQRILLVVEKAARALHTAHEAGVIHRDVKPANVIVTPAGDPVLLDFGLAADEESDRLTLTEDGDALGTLAYMSPEQLAAERVRLDARSDVYSLGVTLYECVTLSRPYRGATREALHRQILSSDPIDPRRLNATLPVDLRAVLETALEKNVDRRYASAAAFADDLARVRRGEPVAASRVGPVGRLVRRARRRPALAALLVALAIGIPLLATLAGRAVAIAPELTRERNRAERAEAERHLAAALDAWLDGRTFDAGAALERSGAHGLDAAELGAMRAAVERGTVPDEDDPFSRFLAGAVLLASDGDAPATVDRMWDAVLAAPAPRLVYHRALRRAALAAGDDGLVERAEEGLERLFGADAAGPR